MTTLRASVHAAWVSGLLLVTPGFAQDAGEGAFSGRFMLGLRTVDVNGRVEKYEQHVNLDDGVRLFDLDLEYQPAESFADEIKLRFDHLGGDPFEAMSLTMRKFGNYKFSFDRRTSSYFYDDIILPAALGTPALANAGDFHTFDFDRIHDRASLEVIASPKAKFEVGFDRYSRRGESTTSLDIQRDEFELDKPLDETMDELGVSFQYDFGKATLVLEEVYRDFESAQEIFLPGQSLGAAPADASILDFYFLDQPLDLRSLRHAVRLNLRPNQRLVVRVAASLEDLELDSAVDERAKGTTFQGRPFTTSDTGSAAVDRDVELFDVDLSYFVSKRIAVIAGVRRHQLDQRGSFDLGSDFGAGDWDIETTSAEAGVELGVTSELSLTLGVREESRDVSFVVDEAGDAHAETEQTDQTGYFASVNWRPSKLFRLNLSVEDSSFDDPFTLASPTDRERYRLQGQLNWRNGGYLTAIYQLQDVENSNSGWLADYDSLSLRGGYRVQGLDVSIGYAFVDVERSIDQLVTTAPGFLGGLTFLVPVFFESQADFIDGRVQWTANDRLRLGADLRFYENAGDFAVDRDDLRVFAEITLPKSYLLYVSYRTIDYAELARGFNDYDADVAELGIGYRF